jgi:pyrroline-5-carboxylate reductase
MKAVGFIGAGNMARALAAAIKRGFPQVTIHASDVSTEARSRFESEVSGVVFHEQNADVAAECDVVFVAVKPQVLAEALSPVADSAGLFVSIAAGVRLERLQGFVPAAHWVRVMPNTPSLVGQMAAGYAAGLNTTDEEAETAADLLGAAGVARRVDEALLDAVTGLSGSGPAFVARLIEAFIDGGSAEGLPESLARDLAIQTFRGTAELLAETGMTPEELVRMVSSPNGTTVAGREVLEGSNYREVLIASIRASAERSKELGR